ncbi:MAG: PAS domain S-box protein, partial [bacterium]|nr:PAS domain S-box protein [bacterium]
MKNLSIPSVAGTLIVLLGGAVMLGWLLGTPLVVQDLAMVFSTAFCFLLLGISLLLADLRPERTAWIGAILGWALLATAGAGLLSALFDINVGLDLRALHSNLADSNPRPGRMAPNTALAFMLSGLALILMRQATSNARGFAIQITSFLVLLLGLTGLVGYALQLELLYPWFKAARMAIPTAVGMVLAGLGLWGAWHRSDWFRSQQLFKDDEKIAFVGTALLVIVGVSTGVAGFAAQQSSLAKSLSDSLAVSLEDRAALFKTEVGHVVHKATSTASGHVLLQTAHALSAGSLEADSQDPLRAIGRELIDSGATGIVIRGNDQQEWLRLGRFSPHPQFAATLDYPQPTVLFWDKTLTVRSTALIRDASGALGSITVEEPVPLVAERLRKTDGHQATGQSVMCVRSAAKLHCYPDNRNRDLYSAFPVSESGKATPMELAVQGKSGLIQALDYRSRNVIAAYRPLSSHGLGLVVKKDTAELFAPIREQLLWSIPVLLVLVALGAAVLRSQLKPLASRLLRSEARIRAVVEGVGEGVVTIDDQGTIESFNAGASSIFGFSATEAIGLNVRLLMPSHMHGPHDAGMKRYQAGGPPQVIGKKHVELPGLRKDGTSFPLELTVNVIQFEEQRSFVGIIRDITQRKRDEALIFAEKERLRVTLGSIGDGVITTDTTGAITYLNPVAEAMTGWTNADAIGRALPTVFHIVNEQTGAIALDPISEVLLTQSAAGLAEDTTLLQKGGARFAIEDSAAPIRNIEGEIIGVVLVFHDVSQARLI